MKNKKQALLDKFGFVLYNGSVAPSRLVESEELYELVKQFDPIVRFTTLDVLAFNHDTVYVFASCNFDEEELENLLRKFVRISNFDTSLLKTTAEYGDNFSKALGHVVMFFKDAGVESYEGYIIDYVMATNASDYIYDEKSGFYVLQDLKELLNSLNRR